MPERNVLEWLGGAVVTAVGSWMAWLTTSRVPQKQFEEYKGGHTNVHTLLCSKLDDEFGELKAGQQVIDQKITNLTDKFIDYLTSQQER